jgi:hypothetical protein
LMTGTPLVDPQAVSPVARAMLRPVPKPGSSTPAPRVPGAGLATDHDPYLGLVGVVALRDMAKVFEEHDVRRAREMGWTWAEIGAVLEVSAQAAHHRPARSLNARASATEASKKGLR